MSEPKKNNTSFILKITYDKDTFNIEDIQEIRVDDKDREYLVLTPNAIDERLINTLTSEDMEELVECYDFTLN